MAQAQNKVLKRRLAGAYVSSVLSISLVLLLVGVAAMLLVNTRSVADYFKEHLQVSVIFKTTATDSQVLKYKNQIDKYEFIRSSRIVTKEEGTEDLREMLGDDFLKVFVDTPVPYSLDINLKADWVTEDRLVEVSRRLSTSPIVDEVNCQQNLVAALNGNMAKFSFIIGIFIALLLFISLVLISNTVRLNVYSQRFNIHTMRLVGATRGFIRRPFMGSAVLQGLVSAFIATAVLVAALFVIRSSFAQLFEIFTMDLLLKVVVIVVLSGVLICMASTYFVVNRLVDLSKDELYG